jgi:hypothetical protein
MATTRPAPHLVTIVEQVHQDVLGHPPRRSPWVGFYPYAEGRSTVRVEDGRLVYKLNEALQHAPSDVVEGIVAILLCKIEGIKEKEANRERIRAYREFMAGPRPESGRKSRKHIEPVGKHRSLIESYLRVTLDMDLIVPEVPTLSWSQQVSRNRFGHWDAEHKCIVISQVLDDPRVPEFVLDYVVYHEVLHIIHPVRMGSGSKRRVHTAAFRRDERKFPQWKEGEAWIKKLARGWG